MFGGGYFGDAYFGGDPASSSGTPTVSGSATASLGALTATATGTRTDNGTATASLGNLTAAATGHKTTSGTAAGSLGGMTATVVGIHTANGTVTASLGNLTATATGTRTTSGTAAASLGALIAVAVGASKYETAVLLDTPTIYYRLGESSGTVARDVSGNGLDGTYNNGPILGATGLISGDGDTAVNFDDPTHTLTRAYDTAMDSSADYSVEAWIKSTGTAGSFSTIASGNALCLLEWDSSGLLTWIVKDTFGGSNSVTYSTNIRDGNTHHVVGVKTGQTAKLYVDGTQRASTTFANLKTNAGSSLSWLVGSGGGAGFGTLDEFAYYKTALSATRVTAHHAAGSGASTTSGTATASLGGFTSIATGTRTTPATAAANLGAVAATATSTRTAHATAAASLGALSGQAAAAGAGIASAALSALTAAISGTRTTPGVAMADLGAFIAAAVSAAALVAPVAGPFQWGFQMLTPGAAQIPVEAGLDFIEWGFVMLQPGDALIGDPA